MTDKKIKMLLYVCGMLMLLCLLIGGRNGVVWQWNLALFRIVTQETLAVKTYHELDHAKWYTAPFFNHNYYVFNPTTWGTWRVKTIELELKNKQAKAINCTYPCNKIEQ